MPHGAGSPEELEDGLRLSRSPVTRDSRGFPLPASVYISQAERLHSVQQRDGSALHQPSVEP
jgi:hypothetical protein